MAVEEAQRAAQEAAALAEEREAGLPAARAERDSLAERLAALEAEQESSRAEAAALAAGLRSDLEARQSELAGLEKQVAAEREQHEIDVAALLERLERERGEALGLVAAVEQRLEAERDARTDLEQELSGLDAALATAERRRAELDEVERRLSGVRVSLDRQSARGPRTGPPDDSGLTDAERRLAAVRERLVELT